MFIPDSRVCFSPKSKQIGSKCVNTYSIVHNVIHYTLETLVMLEDRFMRNQEIIGGLNMAKENNFSTFLHMYSINLLWRSGNKTKTITLAQNQ